MATQVPKRSKSHAWNDKNRAYEKRLTARQERQRLKDPEAPTRRVFSGWAD